MARVLVTGAGGMLGSWLVPMLEHGGHAVVALPGRKAPDGIDLTHREATLSCLHATKADLIVNLAAATDVDGCERDPNAAYLANVRVVENLAEGVVGKLAEHLIQISTDQVYDGPGPHPEPDVTLRNYYAFSKYAGEIAAHTAGATILRTNFFGPSRQAYRRSFSDWIVDTARRGERINVFTDIAFSPLALDTVARSIDLAIHNPRPGVFNLGSHGGMSKADFAFRLTAALGLPDGHMQRRVHDQGGLPARRPIDMRMDNTQFEKTFKCTLPSLDDEILRMKNEYAPNA